MRDRSRDLEDSASLVKRDVVHDSVLENGSIRPLIMQCNCARSSGKGGTVSLVDLSISSYAVFRSVGLDSRSAKIRST
jgi:hypothetical protein